MVLTLEGKQDLVFFYYYVPFTISVKAYLLIVC